MLIRWLGHAAFFIQGDKLRIITTRTIRTSLILDRLFNLRILLCEARVTTRLIAISKRSPSRTDF